MIAVEHLNYLLAIVPVLLIGWIIIHKGANRNLILSRIVIVALLIIALAGPYNPLPVTETDETPSITVLSDETASMDVYKDGVSQDVFDYLEGITPTRMDRLSGLRSDIGDEILASAVGGGHIVVVSDGNNNFGRDVGETIDFVSNTGTNLYAVTQIPEQNDFSVEIIGARTAVEGNENLVGIVVRQALSNARLIPTVMVDGEPQPSKNLKLIERNERTETWSFSNTFYSLGPHTITVQISSDDDIRTENNLFNKTIFVVPKPKILLISADTYSLLFDTLDPLYRLEIASSLNETNLNDYKVVVLDNLNKDWIGDVSELTEYVAEGGGLVIVGGDHSYEKGEYRYSDLEKILPVESYPSTYTGSVNVVLMLDTSPSVLSFTGSRAWDATENPPSTLSYEKGLAIELIKTKMGNDVNLAVITFGTNSTKLTNLTEELVPLYIDNNKKVIIENIENYRPIPGRRTSYDLGLEKANEILSEIPGEKNVIMLSDGLFSRNDPSIQAIYNNSRSIAANMIDNNIHIYFIQIIPKSGDYGVEEIWIDINGERKSYYELLSEVTGNPPIRVPEGEGIDLNMGYEFPDRTPSDPNIFKIIRFDEEHFITRYLNISGNISKFNDVTQKVGAQRLVTTSMGKPIVTSWQFGLGRVVSFSTDNGNYWSGGIDGLFHGENARLMPSIINWVVGDPRTDGGLVVHSNDIFFHTPSTITVYSDATPGMTFGGADIPLIHTEGRTYEGIVNPKSQGVFELVVSAGRVTVNDLVAVNYPLEYRDIGNNQEFLEAVKRNNGGVYSVDQSKSLLFNDIKQNSIRTTIEKVSLKWLFLLAALLLFLGEVILRRARGIIDIKMKRKGEIT